VPAVAEAGADVPGWLRRLAETDSEPGEEWAWALDELTSLLMQSGDLWDAAAVMPFLAELAHTSGDAGHRAAVDNRSPRPAPESTAATIRLIR
jgi:hypothetical protein